MERSASFLSLSGRAGFSGSDSRQEDSLLPCTEKPTPPRVPRIKAVLSHCLYRRVIIWSVASLVLVAFVLNQSSNVSVSTLVEFAKIKTASGVESTSEVAKDAAAEAVASDGSQKSMSDVQADELNEDQDEKEREEFEAAAKDKPWLRFPHLDGYFHGLKALVKPSDHVPEYPNKTDAAPFPTPAVNKGQPPKPKPYSPYDVSRNDIEQCYIDNDKKIPAPDVYAYDGLPQHMPDPALGSYSIFGMRDDVCFDRFGRFGPYGYGYSKEFGGSGVGQDTENSSSEAVWERSGKINYDIVDWGEAQGRCVDANQHRLLKLDPETQELPTSEAERKGKKARQAVIVRCYTGYKWTELAIVNFRAMITELSLKSGGEYSVHILLHVLDSDEPIWADKDVAQGILDDHVPAEFQSIVTLWSEAQMEFIYPGEFTDNYSNPAGQGIHGVYRSAHFPMQLFVKNHPEYEFFWNWEMDMRFLGNYYELFDRVGGWANSQPRSLMWERSSRYYIPSFHGTWDNFTETVQQDHLRSGKQTIYGPVEYPDRKELRFEERGESPLPKNCGDGQDPAQCGVGEAADLITFSPIFSVPSSGWVFSNDITGYKDASYDSPPRRAAIVTAGRLSRRLIMAMHEETWRHHRTMFSEMFPTTVALHHGFKAIFAPHPTYLDRAWTPLGSTIEAAFNSGEDHSTSGMNSPFHLSNEHNQKGTSWYYHSEFAGLLWRRWLGYAQMDGRGGLGGVSGGGTLRGGVAEESKPDSSGRMCLRSMFLHPIKTEKPDSN